MYSLATLTTFLSESKLGPFWTTFLDIKKQLFVSDKFLNFASEEGKTYLVMSQQWKNPLLALDSALTKNDKN